MNARAAILLLPALAACAAPQREAALAPSQWPADLRREAFARYGAFEQPVGAAVGRQDMIAGTTGAPAVAAGREALRAGGSAVDAVLAAAMAQVALAGQSWVSYAGILTLVVYDPKTGRVESLDAGYAVPAAENDALSIPRSAADGPAGRMVLVPGFFAGVQAAHARYGRLPFSALFEPAIDLAEQGFPVSDGLAQLLSGPGAEAALRGSADLRRLLRKPDGSAYASGETLRQPELAATLRAISAQGADYFYRGPWAERCVAQVQAAGGRLSTGDLAAYRAPWSEPVRAQYHGYEVAAAGAPGFGGLSLVEALNVFAAADLPALEDPAERLFWWIQISGLQVISFLDPGTRALFFGGPVQEERRASPEWAAELWRRLQAGGLPLLRAPEPGTHSDALVAVDRDGQVAALVHSSNTAGYWATGIVVDGIVLTDSASSQQEQIAQAGPGARLPDPTNPAIVLRNGRPVLASSSIGAGLHPRTLQCLQAVLDEGLDPAAAQEQPCPHLAAWDEAGAATAQVSAGAYDAALLERVRTLGQPVRELDAREVRGAMGYWVGIRIDPETGLLSGACPARLNGAVFGD